MALGEAWNSGTWNREQKLDRRCRSFAGYKLTAGEMVPDSSTGSSRVNASVSPREVPGAWRVLRSAGHQPLLLELAPEGRPAHSQQLSRAYDRAVRLLERSHDRVSLIIGGLRGAIARFRTGV